MNDEINNKIKEIGSMFGITEFPDNIGDLVESFITSDNNEKDQEFITNENTNNDKQNNNNNDVEKYVQIVNKLKESNFNKKNDKKIQLLHAIEPFLNNKRKDKVNNCIKFITFADLAKDLKIF